MHKFPQIMWVKYLAHKKFFNLRKNPASITVQLNRKTRQYFMLTLQAICVAINSDVKTTIQTQ